jgi:hypothetical protein
MAMTTRLKKHLAFPAAPLPYWCLVFAPFVGSILFFLKSTDR